MSRPLMQLLGAGLFAVCLSGCGETSSVTTEKKVETPSGTTTTTTEKTIEKTGENPPPAQP